MKIKKELFKPAIFLAVITLILCTSVSTVFAIIPEFEIQIQNAPNEYYYAFLEGHFFGGSEIENSELHLDSVDDPAVNAYLQDFHYDGWYYNKIPSFSHLVARNTITYRNIYDPYRILIITMDGTVHLSPVMDPQKHYVYDFQTGEVSVYLGNAVVQFLVYFFGSLFAVFILEYGVFGIFGFTRSKKNTSAFLSINAITHITLTIALYWIAMITANFYIFAAIFVVLEVIVALIEAFYFSRVLVDKKGNRRPKLAFTCGLFANVCSATFGALLSVMILAERAGW